MYCTVYSICIPSFLSFRIYFICSYIRVLVFKSTNITCLINVHCSFTLFSHDCCLVRTFKAYFYKQTQTVNKLQCWFVGCVKDNTTLFQSEFFDNSVILEMDTGQCNVLVYNHILTILWYHENDCITKNISLKFLTVYHSIKLNTTESLHTGNVANRKMKTRKQLQNFLSATEGGNKMFVYSIYSFVWLK